MLDPDRAMSKTSEAWLRDGGWTVFTAGDAAEAVRYADALGADLTLIVVDPGIGFDTLDAVVKRVRQACPKVGVLAYAQIGLDVPIGDGLLQKPFTSAQLLDAARSCIPTGMHFAVVDERAGRDEHPGGGDD